MEDQELILKVKEEADNDSILELVERHSGIYHEVINSYFSGQANQEYRREFIENKDSAIYDSAITYDPSRKAKFPTYLANKTRWDCLNTISKREKLPKTEINMSNLDSAKVNSHGGSGNRTYLPENNEVIFLFEKFVKENFPEKTRKIVDMRYNTCSNRLTPWREVAKEVNMSIQGVINIHNRCISEFKQKKEYV